MKSNFASPVFITKDSGGGCAECGLHTFVRYVTLPWEQLAQLQGMVGDTVLMDIDTLLYDIEQFKQALRMIKDSSAAYDGKLINGESGQTATLSQ